MTQKDKIREATIFAVRVKSIADSILSEGNDYDVQWHKSYCRQLRESSEALLKQLRGK